MHSTFQRVSLTVLAAVAVAAIGSAGGVRADAAAGAPARVAAPAQPTPRPNRIRVTVTSSAIRLNNETPGVDSTKLWALPGGTIVFVIDNRDKVQHSVSIPLGEFVPSPKFPKDQLATPDPLESNQPDSRVVNAGQVLTLVLKLRPHKHFGFDTRPPWNTNHSLSMTYKYNVHSLPAGGKKISLDPDLEVDQP